MSSAEVVRLRRAVEADIGAVADVFLAAWRTSYREVLPRERLAMFDAASAEALWRRAFDRESDGGQVMLAERQDGSVVGVVAFGPDPDDRAIGHIFSLYVHPDAQGTGVGRTLAIEAARGLVARGHRRVSLWVFEANTDAQAFYGRLGWQPEGTTRIEAAYGEPELRLVHTAPAELTSGLPPARGPG